MRENPKLLVIQPEDIPSSQADQSTADLADAEATLKALADVFSHNDPLSSQSFSVQSESFGAFTEEMRYRSLVEQLPAVVFMASLDKGVGDAYVSPQIEASLGFSQDEWLRDPIRWYKHVHPDDKARWSAEAAEMFVSGTPLKSAYRVIARDGRVVWFQCEARMIRGPDGRPYAIHGVGFDITDLKETEQALHESHRQLEAANERLTILDRSKNDFLNLISHEFRTPLNGLLGISELILDGVPSSPKNDELLEMVELSRRRIISILDDALLLTQIDVKSEHLRTAAVSLPVALTRAMAKTTDFAASRRVTLTPPSPNHDFVLGDEALLIKALHTLFETAVKFSADGEDVHISVNGETDFSRITIESHGRTIPGPSLARFFDLFAVSEASTPGGDLGLGPAVASRILALFGGSVAVANQDPPGIRLLISLKNAAATKTI
ncbi:MAG TPA: PAS domain-containing sensor histidine kinase [Candidatus Acidoferrales bacterium]